MKEPDESHGDGGERRPPAAGRVLPVDLLGTLLLTLVVIAILVVPALAATTLRTVVGTFFVLFVPGYVAVSALFPGRSTRTADANYDRDAGTVTPIQRNVDGPERVLLSIGMSAVIAGLTGFGLYVFGVALRPLSVLLPLVLITLLTIPLAASRRRRTPPEERFRVPYRYWYSSARGGLGSSSTEILVNVILLVSIVLACSTLTFALLFPQDGETFTELYLLTGNESGELRASDYPDELGVDESRTLYAAVGNHERGPRNYTLVVELHDVETVEGSAAPARSERLARTTLTLTHNTTEVVPVTVSPRMTGTQLRLTFLLFVGDAPAEPGVSEAYRETHLWIDVSESSSESSSTAGMENGT